MLKSGRLIQVCEKPHFCRLCMGQTPICPLFSDEEIKMLEALTSIKITTNHTVLNIICPKCRLNLRLAYSIQQKMITSNTNFLENIFKNEQDVNTEIENNFSELRNDDLVQICSNICMICGLKTNLINSHIKEHFHKKDDVINPQTVFSCKKCNVNFRYKSLYDLHIENFHKKSSTISLIPKLKTFSCDQCSKQCNSRSQYLSHTLHHQKKQCPICKKTLAYGSIRQHMDTHNGSPQVCEICGVTLKNKGVLTTHLKSIHNKDTFPCEECGRIFKKKWSLTLHQRTHVDPAFMCDNCGKKFFSSKRLNIHIRMTHMKLRPHVCDFCDKKFSSKFALTTHRRQHTNETPYKCEFCGEGFRQNVSLKCHKKSKHNYEEPKNCLCKICGKAFASECALKTHSRLH